MNTQAMDTAHPEAIAGRICEVLASMRLSKTELARRLEMSSGYVSDLAAGRKRPGTEFLLGMKSKFGISADWLLTGEGDMRGNARLHPEAFRIVRFQVAAAHEAVMTNTPEAFELVEVLSATGEVPRQKRLRDLLGRIAPIDPDLELSLVLYNGGLAVTDTETRHKAIGASAVAHFEARPVGVGGPRSRGAGASSMKPSGNIRTGAAKAMSGRTHS